MIFDKVKNAKNYQTIYPALNRALNLIEDIEYEKLNDGINQIDNEIFIVKRDFWDFFPGEKFGELHDKHVDIHLYGGTCDEKIYFDLDYSYEEIDILESNPNADVIFPKTKNYKDSVILTKDSFALFLPGEFHAPKINNDKFNKINKYIIKVKINN
ncbi:YhcH/YjgK/YiaL family protein [Mycoplasma buteonis]|uniref:YhcH/YjgK/YiaL family protein n=1 Tax=Mycoplasma buteonis TaxID=171280 RepID=UPI00055F83AD|nr:YhcH/YjgK/YiaL family protein [Mycoplasma buteonis]